MIDELARGWAETKLRACVDVLDSQRVPVNSEERAKRKGDVPYYGATGQVGWIDDALFDEELLLIGEDGAPFFDKSKPIAYVISGRSWVNNHAHVLRANSDIVSNKYLKHFLDSFDFHQYVNGTTRLKLTQAAMNRIPVRLAPRAEQRRIVAKLDKLLCTVDTCQQRLVKIPVLLKRFRQSVLAAACSGGLSADWRVQKSIDDEWPTEPLSELFKMSNGKSLTAIKRRDGDIPVYGGNGRMGNHDAANADGQVIVIGRVGAQCGNVHFVSGKVWVTDNAISLEAKREVEPAFYAFFLRAQNLNQLSAGTGQPYLSQEILGPIETPIVSLAEQQEIVRRVEELFALADQIEARYAKAKVHVEKLTQSILAKAFRGELVPQDPNDEPASALVERIKQRDNTNKSSNRNAKRAALATGW